MKKHYVYLGGHSAIFTQGETYEGRETNGEVFYLTHPDLGEFAVSPDDVQEVLPVYIGREDRQLRYNTRKLDMSLMPPDWVALLCRIKHLGALKYERDNWRKGSEVSNYLASLCRHLTLFQAGEDHDTDSQQHHLGHVAWNALACFSALSKDPERFDDRYKDPVLVEQIREMQQYTPPAKYQGEGR